MQEKQIDYFDGATLLKGTLISPDKPNDKHSAIILFPAFEGKSEFVINYGHKLAQEGYIVFVADVYGNGETADTIDGCFNLITPFLNDRQLVRKRSVLAFEALKQQPDVDASNIGAMGFCFGGMCVLELARSGAELKAGVSAHGVLGQSGLITHPIKTELLVLHGYQDPQVPPENLTAFAAEMDKVGANSWTFTFFGNGKHSFTDPKTGTFDPVREKEMGREYNVTIANRTYRYALDFFNEKLLNKLC